MTPPTDDRDVASIVLAATVQPSDEFRRELAARIREVPNAADIRVRPSAGRHRPLWTVMAVAAAVALLVAGIVLIAGRSDDGSLTPADRPDGSSLTGDALFAELAGRRWLALERFDDPSPTVLTSDVSFAASTDRPEIVAHDGCNPYGGTFVFDGTAISAPRFTTEGEACDIDVLTLTGDERIELFPDATTFVLQAADGTPLARFTDVDSLVPTTADELPGVRHVDGLEAVEFIPSGLGSANLCTQLTWEEHDDGVVVELRSTCDGRPIEPSRVAAEIVDLTSAGAEVSTTPAGVVLVGERGAIELRDLPTAEIRDDRVTIAAGALFGVRPGLGVTPDELIEAADAILGAPDQDTGWVDRRNEGPPVQTCGLNDFREIAWGDLVAGFWGSGSRTVLLYWYVGDERVVGWNTPDSELVAPTAATGLTTEQGVGIGDDDDAIPDRFNVARVEGIDLGPATTADQVIVSTRNPASTSDNLERATVGGSYLIVDGVVVGFGAQAPDC